MPQLQSKGYQLVAVDTCLGANGEPVSDFGSDSMWWAGAGISADCAQASGRTSGSVTRAIPMVRGRAKHCVDRFPSSEKVSSSADGGYGADCSFGADGGASADGGDGIMCSNDGQCM